MEDKIIKKAFESAEEDSRKKKVEEFKKVIQKTLEKLETKQEEQRKLIKEIQVLKMDIKDFKEGRLDRIEERNEKDEKARKVSIVIIKKQDVGESNFYPPYYWNVVTSDTSSSISLTPSFCLNNTSGTYKLSDGCKYI